MRQDLVDQIKNNPDYKKLVKERTRFSIKLTSIMLVIYFSFILTIAFNPTFLATSLYSTGVTTIGIPIGMSIIVMSFILTGIYTRRANTEFDDLSNKIKKTIQED